MGGVPWSGVGRSASTQSRDCPQDSELSQTTALAGCRESAPLPKCAAMQQLHRPGTASTRRTVLGSLTGSGWF